MARRPAGPFEGGIGVTRSSVVLIGLLAGTVAWAGTPTAIGPGVGSIGSALLSAKSALDKAAGPAATALARELGTVTTLSPQATTSALAGASRPRFDPIATAPAAHSAPAAAWTLPVAPAIDASAAKPSSFDEVPLDAEALVSAAGRPVIDPVAPVTVFDVPDAAVNNRHLVEASSASFDGDSLVFETVRRSGTMTTRAFDNTGKEDDLVLTTVEDEQDGE